MEQAARSPVNPEKERIEKAKKYSVLDGIGHSVMVGFGDHYLTPFAIRLGASNSQLAYLGSIPVFLGSCFQLLGARLVEVARNRKQLVTVYVLLQAMMLLPLFVIPLLTQSIFWLTLIFSFYTIFVNIPAPGWNSWMGDIIPDGQREAYFARRNVATMSALFLSVLTAGLILNYFENIDIWIGFGILFTISFIGRMFSWLSLTKQFEPAKAKPLEGKLTLVGFYKHMRETNFGNFVIFRSVMEFSVMIASPFFAVYMLNIVGLNYVQYSVVLLVPMVVRIFTSTYWGAYCSKMGNRNIMFVSAFLVACVPFLWFLAGFFFQGTDYIFTIIVMLELVTGFAWNGFELTTFNYMLESSKTENRARLFSFFHFTFGFAILLGGLLSSVFVKYFESLSLGVGPILTIFLVSFVLRMLTFALLIPEVKEVKHTEVVNEKKIFFEMLVSRPLGMTRSGTLSAIMYFESKFHKAGKKTLNTQEMKVDQR